MDEMFNNILYNFKKSNIFITNFIYMQKERLKYFEDKEKLGIYLKLEDIYKCENLEDYKHLIQVSIDKRNQ